MTKEELAQDLAYVRTMAEEGRYAPLVGGSFLVLFGLLLGGSYTIQWALLSGAIDDWGGSAFGWLWLAYCVIALTGVIWLARRVRRKPGVSSLINKVDQLTWQTAGYGIGVVAFGCILRMIIQDDYQAPAAIMAAAFALFGVPLGVTAAISNQRWMYVYSILSFAVSLVLWIYLTEVWAYLIAAAASLIVLALPGFILLRREPSAVV